jgi:hypothetical protein
MRRSLLLIAAAFAAGVGVGYLWQPAPASDRAVAPPTAAAPESGKAPLREHLNALPAPDLPTGDGTIRGHVRDDEGAPLEGVLIVASLVMDDPPRKSPKGAAAPQDRQIDDLVADLVRRERGQRESRRTARTGSDGSYELTGIADAKWLVRAYKEGYELQPFRSSAYNVGPGATVDFAGGPIVRIDVDVLMPDGTRPRRAQIRATSQRRNSSSASSESWFPDDRWIELKPHVYELMAEVQGTEYLKSQPQTVNVEPGAALSLVFRLEARPALTVQVVAPEGIRLTDWSVSAMRFAGEKPPDPARLRSEGMSSFGRGPHERGAGWQDLAAGSYLVGAAYSSNSPIVVTDVVQVGAGTTEVELRLPAPRPEEWIAVRVRDPDGASPRDVQLHLGRSPRSMGSATVLERADGAYLLHRKDGGDAAAVWIPADSRALGRIVRECPPGETQEVVLAFERPAFANLDIVGYAKSPHAGWLAFTIAPRGEDPDFRSRPLKPEPEGACRLGPVQPGAFDITVCACLDVHHAWPAATIPVDLRSGEQTVMINVPVLHTVTVRWPGAGSNRSVSIDPKRRGASGIQRQVTDEVTTIERVPAGSYEVRTIGSGSVAPFELRVPEQTEITIK